MDNIRHISFSQKRFTGFRNLFEFEKKRILLASANQVRILSYHPIDISKGVRLTRNDENRGVNG